MPIIRKLIADSVVKNSNKKYLDNYINFICCLAHYCFNNEYIFSDTPEEFEQIEQIKNEIEATLANPDSINWQDLEIKLAVFSLYFPLYTLKVSEKILLIAEEKLCQEMPSLFKKTLKNYHEEQKIKSEIHSLTKIENQISIAVQNQYEENPYPKWIDMTRLPPQPLTIILGKLFPYFELPHQFITPNLPVLIAGCGTGAEAILVASRTKNVEVLAIDLSLSSLAYASRMARELQVNNIVFKQADILSLSNLDQPFSVIYSTGVLHHLDKPVEGLKILVDLLPSCGLIKLGFYSQKARQCVQKAREYIREEKFPATSEGIRSCRQKLQNLKDLEFAKELTLFSDFFSLSNCRDLMFHVNEHAFTIPQIQTILQELGLQFIGFDLPNPQIKINYQKMFPQDPKMNNLFLWNQFEEASPTTFMSMYNFWCQKI